MAQTDRASVSDRQLYRYTSIPADLKQAEIRLLHLSPAKSSTEPLKCHLKTATIESMPKFEALSYTWGGESATETLVVDDVYFIKITPNLASFLRQRRELHNNVVLWVDAVCINQKDNQERNIQVSLMSFIYLLCSAMSIWLGPEANDSDAAMEKLLSLAKAWPFQKLPTLSPRTIKAIEALLNRSWWTRVWIVQELCLGGGGSKLLSSTLYCGGKSIPWGHLVIACARIRIDKSTLRQSIRGIESVLHLESVRWDLERSLGKVSGPGLVENDALQLVADYRHFNATDVRDKIFGLLGMMFLGLNGPGQAFEFKVDYDETVEMVYTKFAVAMIRGSPGFNLLRHCVGAQGPESRAASLRLPSWVPDWSRKRHEIALPGRATEIEKEFPWWAVPQRHSTEKDQIHYLSTYEAVRSEVGKVLEGGRVSSDPQMMREYFPPTIVQEVQDFVDRGRMIFAGLRDEYYIGPHENLGMDESMDRLLTASETRKQREFVHAWVDEKKEKRPEYSAGGGAAGKFDVAEGEKMISVEGVIWDSIKSTHAPFPDELDSDWERSTQFIVAVGQCKEMVMVRHWNINPYGSQQDKHSAFWHALSAGQPMNPVANLEEWLPVVPDTWTRSDPPLTLRSPKQAELAEYREIMIKRKHELGEVLGMPPDYQLVVRDESELLPALSNEENLATASLFRNLGHLWQTQPYDLYHRPFMLPSTVPDPYWECRRRLDQKALRQRISAHHDKWMDTVRARDRETTKRFKEWALKAYSEEPSIVPPVPTDFHLEKYALGRQLFITRRGYIGLGPSGTREGDRVAVLPGATVPFILRGCEDDGYRVVGESYVSGLMQGEAMKKLAAAEVESEPLKLV